MIILGAQLAISLCLLAFALVGAAIVRAMGTREPLFRFGWGVTAAAFLIQGVNSLFHDVFSTVAYLGGPDSAAWKAVLQWHPILNHSRTFLLTTYCVLLAVVLARSSRGAPLPRMATVVAVLFAGMGLGALVGWHEDTFYSLTHFTAVALWDIMELFAMMGLLFVGMNSGAMERGLWFCLSVNGFILALSVLLFAAFSQVEVGSWAPRPWHIQVTKAVLYLLMAAIAVRQLRRVRRGRPMRTLVEFRQQPALSSFH